MPRHKSRLRLRYRTKDLDLIDTDLKEKSKELINQEVDLDKPGFAQHYCLHCAKYFINERALQDHFRTKVHKKRLKDLEVEPFTEKEALAAAGQGSFKMPLKRKMETQPTKDQVAAGQEVKVEIDNEPKSKKSKKRKLLSEDSEMKESVT